MHALPNYFAAGTLYKFQFKLSALDSLQNSSLSVRCATTNVGAVINRPAVKCYDSTLIFGEFVIFYCRADDIRPYGIIVNSPINWNLTFR